MSVDIEVVGICDCIVFQTGHQLARVSEICFSKGGLQIRHYFYLRRQKAGGVRLLVATEHDAVIAQNGGGGDGVCAGRSYRRRRRRRGGRWRAAAVEDRHPPRHRCAPAGCLRRRVAGPSRPAGEGQRMGDRHI